LERTPTHRAQWRIHQRHDPQAHDSVTLPRTPAATICQVQHWQGLSKEAGVLGGYCEKLAWSEPLPTGRQGEYISVMTRKRTIP
jgi:hypothetical protein